MLLLDIETRPMLSYIWKLFDEQKGLSMLHTDSCILSWSAKWHGEKKIMYADQRKAKDVENEKEILKELWELMDSADVIIGHNSKKFDIKRLNARFIKHGLGRPSKYRQIDTLVECKKHFALTSNSLAYVAEYLDCKFQKLKHKKFPGFELWKECLAGNKAAWNEMELYNKQDVLTLEAVYDKLSPWIDTINFAVFNKGEHICSCGSKELIKKGLAATNSGLFQRYKCKSCGKPYQDKVNELTPEERKKLKR
jgi:uncharacterized protein YprB with RNaseH-like and TPR domain